MLVSDKDAFMCDMAETYHIYDIMSLPLPYLAMLASGLGMNSRIKLRQYGLKASWDTVLLAMLIDGWSDQKDKGLAQIFFIEKKQKSEKSNSKIFSSAEDFEAARAEILGGHVDG